MKVVAVMCRHTFLIITSGCLCLSFFLHAAIPGCHDKVSGVFQDCQRGGVGVGVHGGDSLCT